MTIVYTTAEGKKVVRKAIAATVLASGDNAITVTMDELRTAEFVIQYNFSLNPAAGSNRAATPYGTSITGNVVGVTVNAGLGTTLTGEVIASGF